MRTRSRDTDLLGGLRVEIDEVDALLAETGSDAAAPVDSDAFNDALGGDDFLTDLCVGAALQVEEAQVVAVLLAVELDQRLQRVVAWLQDDLTRPYVSVGLLGRLFPPPHPGAVTVGPGSGPARSCLVHIDPDGPLAARRIALDQQVGWYALGEADLDPRLRQVMRFAAADDDAGADLVTVFGTDRTRRRQAATAKTRGTRFVVAAPPTSDDQWETLIREASLNRAGIVLEVDGVLPPDAAHWIQRAQHIPWAISSPGEQPLSALPERGFDEVRADPPLIGDDEWSALFGDEPRVHALTADDVRLGLGTYLRTRDLDSTVRRISVGPIDDLAVRIRPRRDWSNLVVAADRLERLREIVLRQRHRATVISTWGMSTHADIGQVALFHGPRTKGPGHD